MEIRTHKVRVNWSDTGLKIIIAIAIGAAWLGAVTLDAFINYLINKSIIDAIPATAVMWWHFFTFDYYMAWLFSHQLPMFFLIEGIIAIVITIGIALGLFFFLD